MSVDFDLANLSIAGLAPGNELLYDDKGIPSIMVKIPKLTYAQLGMGSSTAVHPAFIVNGQEVDEIYISKYMNIVKNSRAYSLPGYDYANNYTFDQSRKFCEDKGAGWHMMTRMEWGLILRWCQSNGVMPKGNNNYGKHSTETAYKAIPMTYGTGADAGKIFHTATGTGPDTWNHDQSASGIADLVGNGSEWHGAIRRMGQELQILANNNGADSANAQTASSTAWKAIDATTGEFITPDGSGTTENSVKMTWANSKLTYSTTPGSASTTSREPTFANIVCDESIGDEAKLILQSLGMLQYGSDPELFKDYQVYFATNDGERLFLSGCTFGLPTRGLASFYSSNYNSRSCVYTTLGFRSAFVRLPSA